MSIFIAFSWAAAALASTGGVPTVIEAPLLAAAGQSAVIIPALTPVSIEILADIGSKTSKSGDTFPIRLAGPIVVDGREIVTKCETGIGEIIHAKKSSGMGAAGELILAARYLECDGRRLHLRSFQLVPQGKSNIDRVNALSVVSPLPISIIGYFVQGGQISVMRGTVAAAKTASDFSAEFVPMNVKSETSGNISNQGE